MSDLLDLGGKKILITGGCGAIGQVIARTLAQHGASVAINDVLPEEEAARSLDKAGKLDVDYFGADATQPEVVEDLFERVVRDVGLPDVVCCHAGMMESHPVDRYPVEGFDSLIDLNLRSAFVVAQAAAQR